MIALSGRFSRRRILQGMGVLAGSALFPASIRPAFATTSANNDFIKLSRLLTGREMLPVEYMAALFSAFSKVDNAFPQKLTRLRSYIEENSLSAKDLKAKLAADPSVSELSELPGMILTGWYLGIAGSGDNAICVAYVDALAYQEVAEVLRPPSYAYGAYGSWAVKPV